MELVAGRVIADRFRLVRPLGRGGMGVVWVAHDERLDTPCAIKFLLATLDERARARFALEAKSAAQLRSPNVVTVLDHGEASGVPYIAMELLEGEDLATRLARVGKLSHGSAVDVVEQIARALHRAHGAGLVHRDLKPANVFIARDDEREVVKVLDFGIAKATGADRGVSALEPSALASTLPASDSVSMTATGTSMGTPSYMSPEQIDGVDVDARTDLWALAVVAYECLTGRLPFQSESLGRLYGLVLSSPAPAPSSVAPELGPDVDAWFERGLAKDRAARFSSARELADTFTRALHVPVGGPREPPEGAPIDPMGATAALPTPAALPRSDAAGFAATVRHDVTPAPLPSAQPRQLHAAGASRPRRGVWLALGAVAATLTAGGAIGTLLLRDERAPRSRAEDDADEAEETPRPRASSGKSAKAAGSARTDVTLPLFIRGSSAVVELAAGYGHTCARLASGEVTCWGRANDGQFGERMDAFAPPVMMPRIADAERIYAAGISTCVLRRGGVFVCFGAIAEQHGKIPEMTSGVVAASLSLSEGLCVVKATGKVHCITGFDAAKDADGAIAGIADATDVAVGTDHACVVRRGGAVACWGNGNKYQLGGAKTERERSPRVVVGVDDVVSLAAGMGMTCARTKGGDVLCWGDPSGGQLGSKDYRRHLGTTPEGFDRVTFPDAVKPTEVLGVSRADELDVGANFACVVSAGELRCWGSDKSARLGRGTFGEQVFKIGSTPPPPQVILTNVTQVTLGDVHGCALTSAGEVHCWGRNRENQLGVDTSEFCEDNIPCSPRPVRAL